MENCGQMVQRVLREIPGVHTVTVHFPTRVASIKVRTDNALSTLSSRCTVVEGWLQSQNKPRVFGAHFRGSL